MSVLIQRKVANFSLSVSYIAKKDILILEEISEEEGL